MGIRVTSVTHPGQTDKINQDAVLAKTWVLQDVEIGIIAVADGMGGYSSGDRAAYIAIETLKKWCDTAFSNNAVNAQVIFDSLDNVFLLAHNKIALFNLENHINSGTTLTICLRIGQKYVVKNIGDTRCYLLSKNEITQLSTDDSWIAGQIQEGLMTEQEARLHPKQNLLTRCVGMGRYEKPHAHISDLCSEQVLYVCSDGFYKHLSNNEMITAISTWVHNNSNPIELISSTIFARGEKDNISIALMR